MAQPVVSPLAQRLYDYLAPWHKSGGVTDEMLGWPLLRWCTGWSGIIQDVYDVVKTRNGKEGWTALTDPDQALDITMPFLAQLIGVQLVKGETPEQWRSTIKDAAGLYAGTPESIAGELQKMPMLEGSKTIFIHERNAGAYSHQIGFMNSDLNWYVDFWDSFEDGGTTGWDNDGTGYLEIENQTLVKKNGTRAMRLRNPLGHGELIRRTVGIIGVPSQKYVISFWLKVDTTVGPSELSVHLNGVGGSGGQSFYVPPQTVVDGWVFHSYTLGLDADPDVNMELGFIYNTGVDTDLNFYVDDLRLEPKILFPGRLEEIKATAKKQKPIGHVFTYDIYSPREWTWEIVGSTRFRRNPDGYMEETPPPYTTWEEVEDAFATWDDFADNNPE